MTKFKSYTPENVSSEYCSNYNDCPKYLTPAESVLQLQAGGMQSDISHRARYYTEEELEDYVTEEYAVDYMQEYKDFLTRKEEYLKSLKRNPPVNDSNTPSKDTSSPEASNSQPLDKT